MKRLIKAQDLTPEQYLSQHTPQEWLALLFDKIGTPPSNATEDPNTQRLLFNYDKIKPEEFRTEDWARALKRTFLKIIPSEQKAIYLNKFESNKNWGIKIEVGVANIIVFVQKPQPTPQQKPNLVQKFFK